MATRFELLLKALVQERVDFVILGGVALVARGSSRLTDDLDICYARDRENLERLSRALAPLRPKLRGAPDELPFPWDAQTLHSGLNFTLRTDAGNIDLLGEVTGIGAYREALAGSTEMDLLGLLVRVLDLDTLERAKRAAGRVKDLLDLAEIAEIRRRQP
jgi:hypothetical protein